MRILRYLEGTKNPGIEYVKDGNYNKLIGYTSRNWACSFDNRIMSTLAYGFCLGSKAISWSSDARKIVTYLSMHTKYKYTLSEQLIKSKYTIDPTRIVVDKF